MNDFAKKIIELTNSKSEIVNSESFRPDDPMQRCPDISKAKQNLGWEPKISFEQTIRDQIQYWEKNI